MNRHTTTATALAAGALVALAACAPAEQPTPTETTTATATTSPTVGPQTTIARVVDGDTIIVNRDGHTTTVRVIGVNTPETVAPGQAVGCFGREASQFVKDLLPAGKAVNLVPDPTQDSKDRYGRDLDYVEFDDGKDLSFEIIASGHGLAYKVSGPAPQRYATYKAAEGVAKSQRLGLWGACPT